MDTLAEIKKLLLNEIRIGHVGLVVDLVSQKPDIFNDIFEIYLLNEEPVSRYAAWVADTYSEFHPGCEKNYLERVILALASFRHDALKRHGLRMLSRNPLPEEPYLGLLVKHCFEWLVSPQEAVAVKVFSMEILYAVSRAEPALKHELADSIEWRISEEKPAFKNKAAKILKKLYSETEMR